MRKPMKKAAALDRAEVPLPPKAAPARIIIKRTWTNEDASEDRTITLIEQVKPGLLRTYQETRHFEARTPKLTPPR